MAIPRDGRELLSASDYMHLSPSRAAGSPRNGVLWARSEGDVIAAVKAAGPALGFTHHPSQDGHRIGAG
jgi:hypothetical protein